MRIVRIQVGKGFLVLVRIATGDGGIAAVRSNVMNAS